MPQLSADTIETDSLDLTDLLTISDLLLQSGMFRFRVAGWSMYPTLCKGDWLAVEPVVPGQLRRGDFVLFHHEFPHGPRLICHRLVAMDESAGGRRLITNGDAVAGSSEIIEPDQILGRVVAVTRGWPWSRSGSWCPVLLRRIDREKERLVQRLAGWLESIQAWSLYRRLMRRLLRRCFVFSLGVPVLPSRRDFRLIAKRATTCAGSLRAAQTVEGYGIEHLEVRIRYRGLGVASELVRLAATVASARGATALRATIERDNVAARRLFDKVGFREDSGVSGHRMILVREIQAASSHRPLE